MTEIQLENSQVRWDDTHLTVTTGKVNRTWTRTSDGLLTVSFRETDGDNRIRCLEKDDGCDWYIFAMTQCKSFFKGIELITQDSPQLTSPFIEVIADFEYPETGLALKYCIRVYPDAPGFHTQLKLKALKKFDKEDLSGFIGGSYGEKLDLEHIPENRCALGYYNDTQHRNRDFTPIVCQEHAAGPLKSNTYEVYDRASILSLRKGEAGLLLVKESHKCANQDGVDTGEFVINGNRVVSTGLGMTPCRYGKSSLWLQPDQYRDCWANWSILYDGGETEMQLALKTFDRIRFCPDPSRICRSRTNTWGTRMAGDAARGAATEVNVKKEIDTCAELGIDAVAIDDGWQYPAAGLDDSVGRRWQPHPDRFPGGWERIRKYAQQKGVMLDLWMAGQADLEHMKRNYDEGGFTAFKIDFLNLSTRDAVEYTIDKIHQLVEHTGYRSIISWDSTENNPRVGYYFAREYGSLYPANRKPTHDKNRIQHVVYHPRLVFRDTWHLAHYLNLNQIEISIQNVDRILPEQGNASKYSHAYCTALAVMGLPLFFQEVHFYSEEARKEIRPVMDIYRTHREAIHKGYIFPIGDEPCDRAWSGFQSCNPDSDIGYLSLFREVYNEQKSMSIHMHFLKDIWIEIEDLMSGDASMIKIDSKGQADYEISNPGEFRLMKYVVKSQT